MESSTKADSDTSCCYGHQISTTDFTDLLRFLYEYQWLYDFKVTEIFTSCIWKNIPPEWFTTFVSLSQEELTAIPDGQYQESWPESLKVFIKMSLKYSLSREMNQQPSERDNTHKQERDWKGPPYSEFPPMHNSAMFTCQHDEQRFTPLSDSEICSVMPGSVQFTPLVVQEQLSTLTIMKTLSPVDDNAHAPLLEISEQLPPCVSLNRRLI